MMPIPTGFGVNQRGPKSGQGKLADLDALARNRSGYVVKTGITPQFVTSDHWQATGKEPIHPVERLHVRR